MGSETDLYFDYYRCLFDRSTHDQYVSDQSWYQGDKKMIWSDLKHLCLTVIILTLSLFLSIHLWWFVSFLCHKHDLFWGCFLLVLFVVKPFSFPFVSFPGVFILHRRDKPSNKFRSSNHRPGISLMWQRRRTSSIIDANLRMKTNRERVISNHSNGLNRLFILFATRSSIDRAVGKGNDNYTHVRYSCSIVLLSRMTIITDLIL